MSQACLTSPHLKTISRAADFSKATIASINEALRAEDLDPTICVVATGSYGRREASLESDMDFFLLHEGKANGAAALENVAKLIGKFVAKPPSVDGAFNKVQTISEMLENVGGQHDTNDRMTRRLLFLLEGVPLSNEALFANVRRQLLDRYVRSTISNHGIARFLLNDIIRYYRTVCVDFEYKTSEQNKAWGVRNLKLMYSRKLLYFGGVISVAETAQRDYEQKIGVLLEMFGECPIARIANLFGERSIECLKYYDTFLAALSDKTFREHLESVTADRKTHTAEFKHIKNEATHFSWALQRLLDQRYKGMGNPIEMALVF